MTQRRQLFIGAGARQDAKHQRSAAGVSQALHGEAGEGEHGPLLFQLAGVKCRRRSDPLLPRLGPLGRRSPLAARRSSLIARERSCDKQLSVHAVGVVVGQVADQFVASGLQRDGGPADGPGGDARPGSRGATS